MLHRGPVIADRFGLRGYEYNVGVGGTDTFYWDPRQHGGRLILNLGSHTATTAASILNLKLESTYTPTDFEELELVYIGYGGGPLAINASGADGLCIGTALYAPELAAGLPNELIRLRYFNGAFSVIERRGLSYDWSTLDILDSLNHKQSSLSVVWNANYPLLGVRCAARTDVGLSFVSRAVVGGVRTAFSPLDNRLMLGFFDGSKVVASSFPDISDSSITSIHMYTDSAGIAGVGRIFSGVQDRVLGTSDGGVTWTSLGNLPSGVTIIDGVIAGYNSTTRMLIAYNTGYYNRIFVSTDGGTTWLAEALPLATDVLKCITHQNSSSKQFIAVGHDGSNHGRIWRRSVAAAGSGVWTLVNSDGDANTTLNSAFRDMAVGESGKVWFTTDSGATWVQRPVLKTGSGGNAPNIMQVTRGTVSGCVAYYVYYTRSGVGHVGMSLNAGQTFYGRGPLDVSFDASLDYNLGILGPNSNAGSLALCPTAFVLGFGFTVFQRPPNGDRSKLQ